MKYGLWDGKERCWLGNGAKEKGPNLYDDEALARAGATVATRMLKVPMGQIRARPFNDHNLKYRGEVIAERSAEEVLAEMLKGES